MGSPPVSLCEHARIRLITLMFNRMNHCNLIVVFFSLQSSLDQVPEKIETVLPRTIRNVYEIMICQNQGVLLGLVDWLRSSGLSYCIDFPH